MTPLLMLAVGLMNVYYLFAAQSSWSQTAHGVAAALCGMVVVGCVIDANVSDEEIDHAD